MLGKFKWMGVSLFIILGILTALYAKKILTPLTKKQISAESLWNRIIKEDNYQKYSSWPGHKGIQPGKSPHAPFSKVFINATIRDALPIKNKIIPDGGIVVKEAYDNDKEVVNISVMAKVKDYNPKHDDWFWAQYSPDGKVLESGNPSMCINCHNAYMDNDYLIIHKLNK